MVLPRGADIPEGVKLQVSRVGKCRQLVQNHRCPLSCCVQPLVLCQEELKASIASFVGIQCTVFNNLNTSQSCVIIKIICRMFQWLTLLSIILLDTFFSPLSILFLAAFTLIEHITCYINKVKKRRSKNYLYSKGKDFETLVMNESYKVYQGWCAPWIP